MAEDKGLPKSEALARVVFIATMIGAGVVIAIAFLWVIL